MLVIVYLQTCFKVNSNNKYKKKKQTDRKCSRGKGERKKNMKHPEHSDAKCKEEGEFMTKTKEKPERK